MTSLELLQEIDAWLSFNKSPSKKQISELRKDIKKHIGDRRKTTCPDCGDRGWLYDKKGARIGICPCHY